MKTLPQIILLATCFSTQLLAETTDSSTFFQDKIIIKKAAKELLGPKVNYELNFDDSDEAHGIPKGKNKYDILIGKKSYDEYGPGEGSLALTCHEIGHIATRTKEYVGAEENADYWAAKVCMPKMLKLFPNKKVDMATPLDNEFKKACENKEDKEICFRSLRGAYFFRDPTHRDLCNTQKLYLKTTLEELSKTPYKGKRAPNMSQCSFNNLVAGTLNLKQPTCYNLMMSGFNFFGPNCSPGPYSSMPQELGVEEDITEESSISNASRSNQIIKIDETNSKDINSQTSQK